MMLCALVLLTLVPVITGEPGVKVSITQKGLDYAVPNVIKQVLKNMENKDQTGTEEVEYSFKGMKFKFNNFNSEQNFVSGTGISIAVQIPDLYVSGIMIFGRDMIPEVLVKTFSISATVAVKSDETGYPILSMDKCSIKAESYELQDRAIVNNLISRFKKLLDIYLKNTICPGLKTHLNDFNTMLKTAKGFQPPGLLGSYIGKVHIVNPQVKVLEDYVLIGTDIQFGENTSS